jgi:hypothetical protein
MVVIICPSIYVDIMILPVSGGLDEMEGRRGMRNY